MLSNIVSVVIFSKSLVSAWFSDQISKLKETYQNIYVRTY